MKKLLACLSILGLIIGTPAFAQSDTDPATGSRLGNRLKSGGAVSEQEAIYAAQRWATCVYSKRDRTVERFLTTLDLTDQDNAAELVYKKVDCEIFLAGTNSQGMLVGNSYPDDRGLLAEAGLRDEGHLKQSAQAQPVLAMAEGYDRVWFRMTGRSDTVDAMAICLAETQPSLVVNLLRTDRSSAGEATAFQSMSSYLGSCLREGATLAANAFQLRNALADAYYQRIFGQNEQVTIAPDTTSSSPAG